MKRIINKPLLGCLLSVSTMHPIIAHSDVIAGIESLPSIAFSTPIQNFLSTFDPNAHESITGDFNGDGKTDIGFLEGTKATFYFSNGDGTFTPTIQYYRAGWNFGAPSPFKTIVGDFNGDGKTDYARLGNTYAHMFISNGDGSFDDPIYYYPAGMDFQLPSPWETVVGDFNGDGKADFARIGDDRAHFFFSKGDGSHFIKATQYYTKPGVILFGHQIITFPSGFGLPSNYKTIVGDFNNDGCTDYARLGNNSDRVFLSNCSNGGYTTTDSGRERVVEFTAKSNQYSWAWNFGLPSSFETIVGDFNGDGNTDYARLGGTQAYFFLSYGDGRFNSDTVQNYPSGWDFGLPSAWQTIVGDFNGDGITDYIRLGGRYAHLFLNNGNATFSNQIQLYPSQWDFGVPSPFKPVIGDFDGDKAVDYARLGTAYGHIFISNLGLRSLGINLQPLPPGIHPPLQLGY